MKILHEKIADIASQIKTGKTPPTEVAEYFNGNINWYTPTDLSKDIYLSKSSRTITDNAIADNKAVVFDKDTVLITCIGDIGKIGIVSDIASSNQQITGIKLNNKVFPLFFYYWCKRNKKLLENNSRQAVVSILNNETLGKIKISYPENFEDQIRIANVLYRAEKLIDKRKESIKSLDEFLKSTFLEMFGDPVRNEKGWEKNSLKNLCGFITKGTTPKSNDIFDTFENGLIPFIKVYHIISDGTINFNYNPTFITSKTHEEYLKRSMVYPDDILMNIVGPPLGKIGIVPKIFKEWNVNQAIAIFRCGENLNPRYLLSVLKSSNFCNGIIDMAVGVRQLNLSLEQCREIIIPVPPISFQNKFAAIVEKVESMKVKYNESLFEMEKLYGGLSQRAFRGEL